MAQARYWGFNAALNVVDTPLGYTPPLGPSVNQRVNYNDGETNQPSTFTFTNFGANWTFYWLSYMTVASGSGVATVRIRGGGSEVFTPSSGVFPPDLLSQAVLVSTGGGNYQRQLPDGTVEVFNQPDGSGNIFMSEVIDPQGNSVLIQYDSTFRITSINDAIGQETTLTYTSNTTGNAGYLQIGNYYRSLRTQRQFHLRFHRHVFIVHYRRDRTGQSICLRYQHRSDWIHDDSIWNDVILSLCTRQ